MKVINRAEMSDGTKIQLENWRENNTSEYPNLYGYTIGAYPKAQRTSEYGFIQNGKTFRLTIAQNSYAGYTDEIVLSDYSSLKNGEKKLEDLAAHFWNGQKDMYCLGM